MAGQSWCINIVPAGDGVSLNPDVWEVKPGAALQAQVGDLVNWNNQTDEPRQISVSGETLDAKAWDSTNAYQIQNPDKKKFPYTITYTCSTAQGSQSGDITVIA
jgi:hypothetical protein